MPAPVLGILGVSYSKVLPALYVDLGVKEAKVLSFLVLTREPSMDVQKVFSWGPPPIVYSATFASALSVETEENFAWVFMKIDGISPEILSDSKCSTLVISSLVSGVFLAERGPFR